MYCWPLEKRTRVKRRQEAACAIKVELTKVRGTGIVDEAVLIVERRTEERGGKQEKGWGGRGGRRARLAMGT